MKIGFIFPEVCDLNTLMQMPPPQSAATLGYLAIQLAKCQLDVTIFSYAPNTNVAGVRSRNIGIHNGALRLDPALLESDFEVLVFKDTPPEFAASVKSSLPYAPKIYLWTEISHSDAINQGLSNAEIMAQIDAIICVSEWQRTNILNTTDISPHKITTILYGFSPLFADMYESGKEFIKTKSEHPKIAFIAKQDDGLDIMLDAYIDISTNYPTATLGVFSEITNNSLFKQLKALPRIDVYGHLPDTKLAIAIKPYTILANPSVIDATCNIGILNALAAGLYPISCDNAANYEYREKHGLGLDEKQLTSNSLENFSSEVLTICQAQVHSASEFYDYCYKQLLDANEGYSWAARAKDWIKFLSIDEQD